MEAPAWAKECPRRGLVSSHRGCLECGKASDSAVGPGTQASLFSRCGEGKQRNGQRQRLRPGPCARVLLSGRTQAFPGPPTSAGHTVFPQRFLKEGQHLQTVCVMSEGTWRKSPKDLSGGFAAARAPLGTLSQSRRARARTRGGEGAPTGGAGAGEGRDRGERRGAAAGGRRGRRLEELGPGGSREDRGERRGAARAGEGARRG